MAYSLISHAAAGSTDAGLSAAVTLDTTGADLVTIGIAWYGFASSAGTLTESTNANIFTPRTAYYDGVLCGSQIVDIHGLTTSPTHTFTLTSAGTYMTLMVAAFAGSNISPPFDVENGSAPGTAGTSIQPGSVTPSENGELIVTTLNVNGDESGGNLPAIDSGFTILDTVAYSGGNHFLGSFAYLFQGAASAVNPTWSYGVSHERSASIATYKVATAASTVKTLAALGVG